MARLAVKYWKRTGIITPKCPKCERGVMHMEDCCYNSDPPVENYACGTCHYAESHHGVYVIQDRLIAGLQKLEKEGINLTKPKFLGSLKR